MLLLDFRGDAVGRLWLVGTCPALSSFASRCPCTARGSRCRSARAIQTYKGSKPLSEAYTGLYADSARQNINELFEFKDGYVESASNGQCLDAFRDRDKLALHTYECNFFANKTRK